MEGRRERANPLLLNDCVPRIYDDTLTQIIDPKCMKGDDESKKQLISYEPVKMKTHDTTGICCSVFDWRNIDVIRRITHDLAINPSTN